jgi:hypothetical protein
MSLDAEDWSVIEKQTQKIRIDLKSLTEEVRESNRLLRNVMAELIELNVQLHTER